MKFVDFSKTSYTFIDFSEKDKNELEKKKKKKEEEEEEEEDFDLHPDRPIDISTRILTGDLMFTDWLLTSNRTPSVIY